MRESLSIGSIGWILPQLAFLARTTAMARATVVR